MTDQPDRLPLTAKELRAVEQSAFDDGIGLRHEALADAADALAEWQEHADRLVKSIAKRARQQKSPLVSEARALTRARAEAHALSKFIDDHQPVYRLAPFERFPNHE